MESVYTKSALYGSTNLCAGTDTVFLPISEVCDGTVSLRHQIVGGIIDTENQNFRFLLEPWAQMVHIEKTDKKYQIYMKHI